MLAYAAQGLPRDSGSSSGEKLRGLLGRAVEAVSILPGAYEASISQEGLQPVDKHRAFLSVLTRDAGDALAAIDVYKRQPDMIAKVTGQSKYAEDYRADGMLFTKLLLSPYPHARVLHIDASEALAMPGVRGILTMDDLPAPADSITDLGVVIKANKRGERGLAMEPVYMLSLIHI